MGRVDFRRVRPFLVCLIFLYCCAPAFAGTPQLVSISPARGSCYSDEQAYFTAVYADSGGYALLNTVSLLINTSANGKSCCYVYYNPRTNKLYLRNDANTAWLGAYAPGSASTVSNTYATLSCASTTVSKSGNNITVKWSLNLKKLAGVKNTYLYANNTSGANTGWVKKGDFCVYRRPVAAK